MIRGNIRDYIIDVSNLNSEESIELIKTFIEIYENIDHVIFTKKYLKYSNIHDKWIQFDFPDIILSITADEVKEYAKRIKNENQKAIQTMHWMLKLKKQKTELAKEKRELKQAKRKYQNEKAKFHKKSF